MSISRLPGSLSIINECMEVSFAEPEPGTSTSVLDVRVMLCFALLQKRRSIHHRTLRPRYLEQPLYACVQKIVDVNLRNQVNLFAGILSFGGIQSL
jgi:hypothetical protein